MALVKTFNVLRHLKFGCLQILHPKKLVPSWSFMRHWSLKKLVPTIEWGGGASFQDDFRGFVHRCG